MEHDEIIILDFGSQYSHLSLVACEEGVWSVFSFLEFNVYCELFSCLVDVKVVMEKKNVRVCLVVVEVRFVGCYLFGWSK